MKKIAALLFLFILVTSSFGQTSKFRSGLFLHHDVGTNIWGPNASTTSVPNEIYNYNSSKSFSTLDSCTLNERYWPNDIISNQWNTWNDIFNNRAVGADITGILDSNKIVVIKSDFHSSAITGWGTPDDTLNLLIKSVYNYKWLWRNFVRQMQYHTTNYFVIWTNPPEAVDATNYTEANLAHSFCKWAKDTLAQGLDTKFGKFPLNVYVFDYFHKVADASSSWTLKSIYSGSSLDSRPNDLATELVAPQFVQETFNNSIVYEKYFNPSLLTIPALIQPNNGAINQPINITFKWRSSNAATKYLLQVGLDTGYVDLVVDKNNLMDTSFNVTGLAYNTIYYWKVKTQNYGGGTDWSQSRSFTTVIAPPGIPTLISPRDSAVEQDLNLYLGWNPVSPAAATYRIQIAKNASFSPLILDSTNVTVTSILVLNRLDSSTTYFWRVKAINIGGESPWSNIRMFTTKLASPAMVILANPDDGQINTPVNPVLNWYKSARAASYQFQLASDMSFNNMLIDSSGMTDTLLAVSPDLDNNAQYFWRVRSRNIRGNSPWSSIRSFSTIMSVPNVPQLIAPAQGETDVLLLPIFTWFKSSRAMRYHFQLSSYMDYTFKILDNDILTDTTIACTQSLVRNTVYYWRVNCANNAGETGWSESRSFTTLNYPPSIPVLDLPADGATDVPLNATFTWEPMPTATNYRIQIAEDKNYLNIHTDDKTLTSTTFTVATDLKPTTQYFWHLMAFNSGGSSNWSLTRSFTTGIASGVNESGNSQTDFEIIPNPFNESVKIKFSMNVREYVSITVYDLLGREITSMINQDLEAGDYSVNLDNSKFINNAKGILICKLRIGDKTYLKKMVYLP